MDVPFQQHPPPLDRLSEMGEDKPLRCTEKIDKPEASLKGGLMEDGRAKRNFQLNLIFNS